jgi:2',3'-cyclic-nucleotide 2'-phosphodiesterase (5'-nucleotidase family)
MSYVIVTTGQGDKETFVRVDDVKVAGKPIDPKAYYTLATNDYLADGGDGYTMLKGPEQLTLLGLMMDIFADEVRSLSEDGPFTYGTEGRITVKNVEIEEVVTGETTVYLLAGGFFLATAGLFLALSRRKVEES